MWLTTSVWIHLVDVYRFELHSGHIFLLVILFLTWIFLQSEESGCHRAKMRDSPPQIRFQARTCDKVPSQKRHFNFNTHSISVFVIPQFLGPNKINGVFIYQTTFWGCRPQPSFRIKTMMPLVKQGEATMAPMQPQHLSQRLDSLEPRLFNDSVRLARRRCACLSCLAAVAKGGKPWRFPKWTELFWLWNTWLSPKIWQIVVSFLIPKIGYQPLYIHGPCLPRKTPNWSTVFFPQPGDTFAFSANFRPLSSQM